MRSWRSSHTTPIAGWLALFYIVLVGLSTSCLLAHAGLGQEHHEGNGSSEQRALCAWACQTTADIVPTGNPAVSVIDLVVASPEPTLSQPVP